MSPFTWYEIVGFRLRRWFTRVTCKHTTVRVARRHANTVPADWARREVLYVDRFDVVCYVECCRCRHVFQTDQREGIYEQRKDPS